MMRRTIPVARQFGLFLCLFSVTGCANSLPIFSELLADKSPITTSSIFSTASTLSTELNAADWERANAALEAALKPNNTKELVQWENEMTAARGNFRPLGIAFVKDGDLCRVFAAQIVIENVSRPMLQGTACQDGTGEWKISDVKRLIRQG